MTKKKSQCSIIPKWNDISKKITRKEFHLMAFYEQFHINTLRTHTHTYLKIYMYKYMDILCLMNRFA